MWGQEEEAPEENAFSSRGKEPFPPIYEDSKDVRNFSDEKKWRRAKRMGRLALYRDFLDNEPMEKAKIQVVRIIRHLTFEIAFEDGPEALKDWITTQQMEAGDE